MLILIASMSRKREGGRDIEMDIVQLEFNRTSYILINCNKNTHTQRKRGGENQTLLTTTTSRSFAMMTVIRLFTFMRSEKKEENTSWSSGLVSFLLLCDCCPF